MSKKKVLSLALAVIMIAILSFSTLAWFNDTDEVTNKFQIATSDDPADPDDIFSVDVWEDKNGDGNPDDDITGEDEGLIYENILPGDQLKKEVFVENTGAYDQYVRVLVVISGAREWKDVLGHTDTIPALTEIVDGVDTGVWTLKSRYFDPANNNLCYVLLANNKLGADGKINVFDTVKIPKSLTKEQAAEFAGGFEMDILAQAVQTENVGGSCEAAFRTVGPDEFDVYKSMINPAP